MRRRTIGDPEGVQGGHLTAADFEEITELRVHGRQRVEQEARRRKRRLHLTLDGKLVLVALDHPARGFTAIRGNALAMGDRFDLLSRARRVLQDPDVDGVLASPDVMEELFLLNYLERRRGGPGFLDHRVLAGSMNRGGIAGAVFEMEDSFTGFTARRLRELRCEAGKMLWRLDLQDPASGRTMLACATAMNELRRRRLAAFLEPLAVRNLGERYETLRDMESLIRQCGVASAMGESSLSVWLKLPYGSDFARVCRSTTLPILLLGGPAREDPTEALRDFAQGLSAGPQVRGAVIGRNLLFPGELDPFLMSRALTALVHRGAGIEEALRLLQ